MKIGVIYTAYNTEDYIEKSLHPWLASRPEPDDKNETRICAVNVPFIGFPNDPQDRTRQILRMHQQHGNLKLIESDESMAETEARTKALHWLIDQGMEVIIQVDSDEVYKASDIQRLVSFVESQPLVSWFRVCLKNLVFDTSHYLAEPFTPPRIHRVRAGGYEVHSFSADNDISYGGTITRDILPQDRFASMTIPKEIAWIRHFSWLSNERSRKKIAYQVARWKNCSFAWDDNKGLVFNKAYYLARGESLPEVLTD